MPLEAPALAAFPVPDGWQVDWNELSCGSGGCPFRTLALSRPTDRSGVVSFLKELRALGWNVVCRSDNGPFTAAKARLQLEIDTETTPATSPTPSGSRPPSAQKIAGPAKPAQLIRRILREARQTHNYVVRP